MPKAAARCATNPPTRPRPKMASVFSYSSHPLNLPGSQRPACIDSFACAMLRALASISAMACSAADMMFEFGALQTTMPASVAASRSMLSMLTPARPMMRKREAAASMTLRVTGVRERTIMPSYSPMHPTSSSSVSSSLTSTPKPRFFKTAIPARSISSVTRTLFCMAFPSTWRLCGNIVANSAACEARTSPMCRFYPRPRCELVAPRSRIAHI